MINRCIEDEAKMIKMCKDYVKLINMAINNQRCTICNRMLSEKEIRYEILNIELYINLVSIETIKKVVSKFSAKYPDQCEKLKSLIPQLESLDKELINPKREKQEEVIVKFFAEKNKTIRESSSFCENCYSEIKKQREVYIFSEEEQKKVGEKFKPLTSQLEQLWSAFSEEDNRELDNEYEIVQKNIFVDLFSKLNKNIERERGRESKNGSKPTNWTPLWIGLAVIGTILLLILILYFAFRKKKSKKVSKSGN